MQKPQDGSKPPTDSNMKEIHDLSKAVKSENKGMTLVDSNGVVVHANDKAQKLFRAENKLEGERCADRVDISEEKQAELLEEALNDNREDDVWPFVRDDGTKIECQVHPEKVTINGEPYVACEFTPVEDIDDEPEETETDVLEEIPDEEIQEIAQNIRIESDDGKIPLDSIMLDIAVMQNELQQSKEGAYTLYRVLSDRLEEEKEKKADPAIIEVIRQVRDSAQGIYLRVERGDEELHGNRDGKYSGYFE